MNKLTQEEKRIRIAEACRWRIATTHKYSWVVINPINMEVAWSSCAGELNEKPASLYLPDYFGDLNACHAAEHNLDIEDGQWLIYSDHLDRMTDDCAFHATASQRAEALGLTLGLWKEGE